MHRRGFTLIELLVVVAIIGILASIIMVSLQTARAKARDGRRIADIKSIQLALETYYNDNLMYPKNIYSAAGGGCVAPTCGLAPTYMPTVPTDPLGAGQVGGGANYFYTGLTTGGQICNTTTVPIKYHLGAVLEISANDGTGNFSQDADVPANAANACINSNPNTDFNGLSVGCTVSGVNGHAGDMENCYDVVNQ